MHYTPPSSASNSGNGFYSVTEASPLINIRYSIECDGYNPQSEEYIYARLKSGLVDKLFNNKQLYIITKDWDADTNNYRYSIDINISKRGYKFSNVVNSEFRVQDEAFTEEELISAVQIAYPERFI